MLNQIRRNYLEGFSKKLVVAVGVVAAFAAMGGTAKADTFNTFTIDPQTLVALNTVTPGGSYGTSTPGLGKFDGQYTEIFTVPSAGQFTTTAEMLFTGLDDTTGAPVGPAATGLAQLNGYEIYATFNSSGSFSTDPNTGATTFTSTNGTATLWADPDVNTTFANGVVTGGSGDDQILANATLILGQGTLNTQVAAEGFFSLLFNDSLTNLGKGYFIFPNPFYMQAKLNGVFDPFTPVGGSQIIHGSGNLFFETPEPATLTLLGLGLLGGAASRRRRRVSKA